MWVHHKMQSLTAPSKQWRGVGHRTPNETTVAPLDPTTLPHASQHLAVVGTESDDEMNLDSTAYKAYKT
jgi:hypothetical protein